MTQRDLSDRQRKMLEYIQSFVQENNYPPTIREIGEACDISSTSVVNYNLEKLVKAGLIVRDEKISRGIQLPHRTETLRIPTLGSIFATHHIPVPDSANMSSGEAITITSDLLGRNAKVSDLFALEVKGDSMIDAMVNDGDIVVLKPAQTANNGDMVAAMVNGNNGIELTLKHFYRETDGRVRLQPANPTMRPLYLNAENVQIQGKVVLVVRQLPG
ncbi:MAG TPA: transcriptional repressor LexA [Anaerolineales bacterium]|nr:transcriptional repressor LexA [Anaerolineales bacterium]